MYCRRWLAGHLPGFLLLGLAGTLADAQAADSCAARALPVATAAELAAAVAAAATTTHPVEIHLAAGDYHLSPRPYQDPTCGNCEDPARPVAATLGLRITGRGITLRGGGPDSVRIHTHAGYGLLFEDCIDCAIRDLTVTGGERDTAGHATDAAIVARRTNLSIAGCRISDNIGDSATVAAVVVGIMGICGRAGADLTIHECALLRNSWDGVALYRNARARITDSLIDGVDGGRPGPACGGRGVAIGVTWNARAVVSGNLIRRYWKGIGVFVDAEAEIHENVIEDMLTWGIALWDAGRGTPYADIAWNVVHRTGACGISVTRGKDGGRRGSRIYANALLRTGTDPRYDAADTYCFQRALAIHARADDMQIDANLAHANREPGDAPGADDLNRKAFTSGIAPLVGRLSQRPAARQSAFFEEFGEAN